MVGAVLRGRDCAIFLLILVRAVRRFFIPIILLASRYHILKPKFQLLASSLALFETHANT